MGAPHQEQQRAELHGGNVHVRLDAFAITEEQSEQSQILIHLLSVLDSTSFITQRQTGTHQEPSYAPYLQSLGLLQFSRSVLATWSKKKVSMLTHHIACALQSIPTHG